MKIYMTSSKLTKQSLIQYLIVIVLYYNTYLSVNQSHNGDLLEFKIFRFHHRCIDKNFYIHNQRTFCVLTNTDSLKLFQKY